MPKWRDENRLFHGRLLSTECQASERCGQTLSTRAVQSSPDGRIYSAALCAQGGTGGGSLVDTRGVMGRLTFGPAACWLRGVGNWSDSERGSGGGGSRSLVGPSGGGASASGSGTLRMLGSPLLGAGAGCGTPSAGGETDGSSRLGDEGGAAASSNSGGGGSLLPNSELTRPSASVGALLGVGSSCAPGQVRQREG